jgi:hypothetical protein
MLRGVSVRWSFHLGAVGVLCSSLGLSGCKLPSCEDDTQLTISAQGVGLTPADGGFRFDFGTVMIGNEGETILTLRSSCGPLAIDSIDISGSPDFTFQYPNQSFMNEDAVLFTPTTVGDATATFFFHTNSARHPTIDLVLVGHGAAPIPAGPPCINDGDCQGVFFCNGVFCQSTGTLTDGGGAGPACAPESTSCVGTNGRVLVNTLSDPRHCGACNHACPAGMGCSSGRCGQCPGYRIGAEKYLRIALPPTPGGDAGLGVWSMVLGDFTGDGFPDVLFGSNLQISDSFFGGTLAWLIANDGQGGFGNTPVVVHTGEGVMQASDFNGDCLLDVSIGGADMLLGNGQGLFPSRGFFTPSQNQSLMERTTQVQVADINQDGYADIVVGGSTAEVMRGDGTGNLFNGSTFIPFSFQGYTGGLYAFACGDFDGDGRPDVAGATQYAPDGPLYCFTNTGDGELSQAAQYANPLDNGDPDYPMASGDIAGIGHDALVYANDDLLVALPDPSIGAGGKIAFASDAGFYAALVVADLDLDGKPDVLAAAPQTNGSGSILTLWTGFARDQTDGGFLTAAAPQSVTTTVPVAFVAVADVNGDGIPDIVAMGPNALPISQDVGAAQISVFLGSCP